MADVWRENVDPTYTYSDPLSADVCPDVAPRKPAATSAKKKKMKQKKLIRKKKGRKIGTCMFGLIYWANSLKSQFNAQSLKRFCFMRVTSSPILGWIELGWVGLAWVGFGSVCHC